MGRYHYHFVIFGTILATLIYPLGVCVLVLGEQTPSVWIYLECLYYLVIYYLFPWAVVSFGNMIIIEDEKGYQLVFAHLLQNSVSLSKGDYVKHGQVIGQIGNSGNTTEPHLHIHAQSNVKGEIHGVPLCIGKRNAIRNRVID